MKKKPQAKNPPKTPKNPHVYKQIRKGLEHGFLIYHKDWQA